MNVGSVFSRDVKITDIYDFVIQLLDVQITKLLNPLLVAHLFVIKYDLFVFDHQYVIFMTSYNLADYLVGLQNLYSVQIVLLLRTAKILNLYLFLFLLLYVFSEQLFRSLAIRLHQLSQSIVSIPFSILFIFF